MNTENFTIDQNDVDQANEKAKDITVEKIPSIIMSAMAGGSSSDNADDGDAKGLILTKYELQKIREYVAFGLTLPLDDAGISEKMPYTDNKGVFNTKKYFKISMITACYGVLCNPTHLYLESILTHMQVNS